MAHGNGSRIMENGKWIKSKRNYIVEMKRENFKIKMKIWKRKSKGQQKLCYIKKCKNWILDHE